jgi:hypothetical protein
MRILFALCLIANGTFALTAQMRDEDVKKMITQLENRQVEYLLRDDIDAMQRQWSKDYTVNNPVNVVVNANEGRIRKRIVTYSKFERIIEKILVHANTVIVMGSETVVPNGKSPNAGKTLHRRFTDVWMNEDGKWRLVGRHANVICKKVEGSFKIHPFHGLDKSRLATNILSHRLSIILPASPYPIKLFLVRIRLQKSEAAKFVFSG